MNTPPARRVPMILRTRPWTAGEKHDDPVTGKPITRIRVKRDCNGCGATLGDATNKEVDAAMNGRRLPDVRAECPFCSRGK